MNTKKNKSKNTKKKTIRNKKVHGGSKEQWNIIYNKLDTIEYSDFIIDCQKRDQKKKLVII